MYKFMLNKCLVSIVIFLLFVSTNQLPIGAENNLDSAKITVENVNQIQVLNSVNLAPIHQLAWSSDEKRLAVATQEGVWLYNAEDGTTELIGKKEFAGDVSFLGNTKQIAVDYTYRSVIFDTETLKLIRQLPNQFDGVSHNGKTYAVVKSEAIQLFSIADDTQLNQIPIHYLQTCEYACVIPDLAFSWDDKSIVFSSGVPEVENGIVDIKTGKRLAAIQLGIWGLEFNPESTIIASSRGELGYLSRSVEFTDSTTGELISVFKVFGSGASAVFNSDGHLVAISGLDDHAPNPDVASGNLYFFDVDKVKNTPNLDASLAVRTETFSTWITSVQFSPSSKYLAVGDKNGELYLWGLSD